MLDAYFDTFGVKIGQLLDPQLVFRRRTTRHPRLEPSRIVRGKKNPFLLPRR